MEQESMTYDVIIVGAGPAGLAAGIRLQQQARLHNRTISVCILEKGAQVGSHILSGAVLNPCSLKTLLPDQWQQAPLKTPVTHDYFYWLSKNKAYRLPTPPQMKNHGHYIISLGELTRFLAELAQQLGCELYTGFSASTILYNDSNHVIGVSTGPQGLDKSGNKTPQYQPGMKLFAKQTLLSEGCRGQLSENIMQHFQLREGKSPQTYGLGIKEIWQMPTSTTHNPGHVIHTVGWPLDTKTYGGSFIYHLADHQIAIGFVVGLDYTNPLLSPFEEMQRFKTHPFVRSQLAGGERIAYGARALNEGGWQSLPKLTFPGGALLGDAAGFLNVPQIKGIHLAIQSGIFAADACLSVLEQPSSSPHEALTYTSSFEQSSFATELRAARNIRPGFRYGLWAGLCNAAFETYITRGKSPWTFNNHADYTTLQLAACSKPIHYPKPDGILTFDRLSSVYLTNTHHEENQPVHLILRDPSLAISVNYKQYASPETRYCPAGVYEIINPDLEPTLQINAANCIHCKTCDIKDPRQNIIWTAPEGDGGPNYLSM